MAAIFELGGRCSTDNTASFTPRPERATNGYQGSRSDDEVKYNKKRVIVTRRGKQLVAIVPIEDLEVFQAAEDSQDLRDARRVLRKAEKEGTIPWEEVKRRHKA